MGLFNMVSTMDRNTGMPTADVITLIMIPRKGFPRIDTF